MKEKEQFKQLQENYIKLLRHKLPIEILNEVADIRVLALDKASFAVKMKIFDYCKEQKTKVQKTLKDYQQYHDKEFKDIWDTIKEDMKCIIENKGSCMLMKNM